MLGDPGRSASNRPTKRHDRKRRLGRICRPAMKAANIAWTGTAPDMRTGSARRASATEDGLGRKMHVHNAGHLQVRKLHPLQRRGSTTTPNTKSWSKLRPSRPPPARPAKAAQKAARARAPPHRVPPQPAKARRDPRYPVLRGSARASTARPSRGHCEISKAGAGDRLVVELMATTASLARPDARRRWSGDPLALR